MAAIKGHVQLAKSLNGNPKDFLERIEVNVDRLSELSNKLLNLSRIENGNDLIKKEIFTEDLLNMILLNMEINYAEKKIEVVQKIFIEHIKSDRDLLNHILTNIIDNAFKYTPKFGKIFIEWSQSKKGKHHIIIEDSGIGIPNEEIPNIFERFYRIDTSRSNKIKGSGLGLAIVKHSLKKLNGQISVESKVSKGSRFHVIL